MARKIKISSDEFEKNNISKNNKKNKIKKNKTKKFSKINLINKKVLIGFISLISLLLVVLAISKLKIFRPSLEKIKDSVVMIEVYDTKNDLVSTGSGFCAYKKDYIVTNFHVIEGGYKIKIVTDEKEKYDVKKIVVFNQKDDLAIIQINGELKPLKIDTRKKIKVKDKVTAIGSPKGELNTVSEGIISNVDDDDSIRISVPISHGSSGGVLLNDNYKVIGITNAGYDDAENLNFAISSKLLKKLYTNYKNGNYDVINSNNRNQCIPNIINYNTKNHLKIKNKCSFSDRNVYTTKTLNDFYVATNSYEIFNTAMYKLGIDGFNNNYKKLSGEEQWLAAEYYEELLKYEDCDSDKNELCLIDNINSWNKEQMVMELDVLKTYELAIFEVEIDKYNSNSVFNYVNSLPLSTPHKAILLLLYGGYDPSDLSYNDAEKVANYINELNLSINEKAKILSYLGYTINGSHVSW